ncbi:MAG: adenosylcobinamide-phosphate synthase CbiB [Desulfotignum sp.]|nr:adenosylcobinamide-phosphate synthase CbiB [Desulfotignum sp.]
MIEVGWYILLTAFVLDFFLGDPRNLPHPVVGMGKAIGFLEPLFRRIIKNSLTAGGVFAGFLVGATYVLAWIFILWAGWIHPVMSAVVQTVLLFYCFSVKGLKDAAMAVSVPLSKKDLVTARKKVGWIVGRDTRNLDDAGVSRAAVETVAENFVDGFLAPLFWVVVSGVPGAVAYKMINTLDSMVGYKNDRYLLFGRVSARLDDAANFIPARLSVFVIAAATAFLPGISGTGALRTGWSEGRRHSSPNAGFPEASFAGALKIRLGGPSIYHGRQVDKPFIGSQFGDPEISAIHAACRLMQAASVAGLLGAVVLTLVKSTVLKG